MPGPENRSENPSTREGIAKDGRKPRKAAESAPRKTVTETLKEAVEMAEANPNLLENEANLDWSAYWPHALPLWERGWTWRRIYLHFDTQLRLQNRQMPGDPERFAKAMANRKEQYMKETNKP